MQLFCVLNGERLIYFKWDVLERHGYMNYVEPIRDVQKVKDIGEYLKSKDEKFYVMYAIGIYSGLRISDILSLKVSDVQGKEQIKVREKKTDKEKIFPVNAQLKPIIKSYCEGMKGWEYLIPSTKRAAKPISREYAYRIMHDAGKSFGLDHLGTHTLRKTFGYHFYVQTKDIVLLMRILNHNDQSKTLRYIGIEQTTINEAMKKFKY